MSQWIRRILLLSPLLITFLLEALPPPAPSAGIIEREIEKEYEGKPLTPDKEIPAIQIDIPEKRLSIPGGKNLLVKDVMIRGNNSISSKQILRKIAGYLDQKLSLSEIYDLCQVIHELYAEQGYFLARAYPPPQDVKNHVLEIEVIEGNLGNITIVGNQYYSERFIRSFFTSLQNKPLRYDKFLRALMLLNENSDLKAGALFEKGKKFGSADVVLRIHDARPIHLYLNGNNYGRDLTTNARVGGRFDWGNLITQGDTLSIAEVIGFPVKALYFTDVSYNILLNRCGTSLKGSFLYSQFHIEELLSLHLKGRSMIATLKVNHALTRTRSLSIDLFSYFDYKQIADFELGSRVAFDKLRVLTVGTLFDRFIPSQKRDYLVLRFAAGIPNFLGGLKPVDNESSREGGGGRFFILNLDYDRLQHLPNDCFFYFHGSGQLSPNKLTLPEVLYIGGIGTVRGFPLAVALGDSGYYVNCEFRFPPPGLANKKFFRANKKWKDVLQFDAFLDQGGAFLQSSSNTFLWGAGLGVRVQGPFTLSLSLDVGFPLNHRDSTPGAFMYLKIMGQPF